MTSLALACVRRLASALFVLVVMVPCMAVGEPLTSYPYTIQYSGLKLQATALYIEHFNDAETNPLNVSFRRIYLVFRTPTDEFIEFQYHDQPSTPSDPDFLRLMDLARQPSTTSVRITLYCKIPEASLPAGYVYEHGQMYYAKGIVRIDNQGAASWHRNCYIRQASGGL